MIQLRLQRKLGPLWLTVEKPVDAGHDAEDATEQAVYWLAECYCGSYPVTWPGPYRVELSGGAVVNLDHPLFARFCEEMREAERESAVEANAGFRR